MPIEIEDIQKITTNRGGAERAYLIFEEDIASFPAYNPSSHYFTGAMQLKPGARAYPLLFTTGSASFSERTLVTSPAGDLSEYTFSLRTPKDRPELYTFRERMKNRRVAIVYRDWNKYFKLVRQLRATPETSTNNLGGYNGTSFRFDGRSLRGAGFWQYEENTVIDNPEPIGGVTAPPSTMIEVNRLTFSSATGDYITLPSGLPTEPENIHIYRSTGLIPWGFGVARSGNRVYFTPALDGGGETIEVVYFTEPTTEDQLEPYRLSYASQTGTTLNIPSSVPTAEDMTYIFRNGRLIPWDEGVSRAGDVLTFSPTLAAEHVHIVYFDEPAIPIGSDFTPHRLIYSNQTGLTLTLPSGLPSSTDYIMIYRSTGLIPWGAGVSRVGETLTFSPALYSETVEVVWFQ